MGDLLCGLKLTHDGGVAVLDGDRLLFSVEAEKLENRPRYSRLDRASDIVRILADNGLTVADLAGVAVDGWGNSRGGGGAVTVADDAGEATRVEVAAYRDRPGAVPLEGPVASAPLFGTGRAGYRSFTHATDHALASYCTSPYAADDRPALVLVWDGGMPPVLYHVDPARPLVALAPVMPVSGGLYPIFATHLGPFRGRNGRPPPDPSALDAMLLPVSGKAMAYTALGEPAEDAIAAMRAVGTRIEPTDVIRSYQWSRTVLRRLAPLNLGEADVLASFQEYLGRLLVRSLRAFLDGRPGLRELPVCLSGGCALNIKWNSRLRDSNLFPGVWVPPFPNDAGSAIGAACAERVRRTGRYPIRWSVFAGPPLGAGDHRPPDGWTATPCPVERLAQLLAVEGEPVVVLAGRAETGPRALGHRSIIAPATAGGMRDRLNAVKGREWYRPVAPICLEEKAGEVFSPGVRDPYMLFDHRVRPQWRDMIPAVVHIDGTARVQTVGTDNPLVHRLLGEYHGRTGIPVLCNTSANRNGCGFFPDAASAMRWGGVRYVWADGTLYRAAPAAGVSGPPAAAGVAPGRPA